MDFCFYSGPSAIDGAPIVGIVTGLGRSSRNTKTGEMLQVWILRSDMHPVDAVKSGDDSSICGDCFHRGDSSRKRSCYVRIGNAPSKIYKAYRRGRYPLISLPWAASLAMGKSVRCGAYGDPCAIPYEYWSWLPSDSTGYTHQWKWCDHRFASFLMASVDSLSERILAKSLGFRTFRVRPATADKSKLHAIATNERLCPAASETSSEVTCKKCMGCGGFSHGRFSTRDYVIMAHGKGASYVA